MIISFKSDFLAPRLTYQVNSIFFFFLTFTGFGDVCSVGKIVLKLFYMDVFHVNGWGNIGKSFLMLAMPKIQWKII